MSPVYQYLILSNLYYYTNSNTIIYFVAYVVTV